MKARAFRTFFLTAALFLMGATAFAASITVDKLELLTHGAYDNDNSLFSVKSRLYFDLSFEGGDKFAGLLKMDFLSGSLEDDLYNAGLTLSSSGNATKDITTVLSRLNSAVGPRLRTAAISARRLFDLPIEATYFIGTLDTFCSGDDFVSLFGAAPFGTELSGPMASPDGIGGDADRYYDGLDTVYGTGLRLGYVGKGSAYYLYAYQDSDLGAGNWTGDLRALFDTGALKLETYAGGSYAPSVSNSSAGIYRGGLLFDYAPGNVGEFLAQIGMTRWNALESPSINNFYFLFEPRINFYPGSFAITVFYHPAYYREKATNEQGSFDLNFNLKFGNVSTTGSQGGVTSLLSFRPYVTGSDTFTMSVSPYYAAIASGVEWSFKLDLRILPVPTAWYAIFRPYVGVKTSF
jgi:hypothetical protein